MKTKTTRLIALMLSAILLASVFAIGAFALTGTPTKASGVDTLTIDDVENIENASVIGVIGGAVTVFRCVEYLGKTIRAIDAVADAMDYNPYDFKGICFAAIDAFTGRVNVVAPPSSDPGISQEMYKDMISEIDSINSRIGEIEQDIEKIKASMSDIAATIINEQNKEYINDFSKDYIRLLNPLMTEYDDLMLHLGGSDNLEGAKGHYDALYEAAFDIEEELYQYLTGGFRYLTDGKSIQDVMYDYVSASTSAASANAPCIEFTENLFATYSLAQYCLLICRLYQLDHCNHLDVSDYTPDGSKNPISRQKITEYIQGMDARYETIATQFGKYIVEKGNHNMDMLYVPSARPEQYPIMYGETQRKLYLGDTYYCTSSFPQQYEYILVGDETTLEVSDETAAKITEDGELQLLDKKDFQLKLKFRNNVLFTYSFTIQDNVLSGGYGTINSPYLIGSKEELLAATNSDSASYSSYKLISDIAFTDDDSHFTNHCFNNFSGIFDGNGYSISNLTIKNTNTSSKNPSNIGFFSTVTKAGKVKDLRLYRCSVQVNSGYYNPQYAGVLVGSNNGSIYNCTVENSTISNLYTQSANRYQKNIGAIAGCNGKNGIIAHCQSRSFNFRNSILTFKFYQGLQFKIHVGGLVGETTEYSTLRNNLVTNSLIDLGTPRFEATDIIYNYTPSDFSISLGSIIGTRAPSAEEAVYSGSSLIVRQQIIAYCGAFDRYIQPSTHYGTKTSDLSAEAFEQYGLSQVASNVLLNKDVYQSLSLHKDSFIGKIPYGQAFHPLGIRLFVTHVQNYPFPTPVTSISGFDPYTTGKQTVTLSYVAPNNEVLSTTVEVEVVCEHEFSEWEKIDDTTHSRSCRCGETETAEHAWDDGVVSTEPSCTVGEEKTFTCSVCGTTRKETAAAIGHVFGEWTQTVAPECTKAGEERRDCSNCDHFETREVAQLGHIEVIDYGYSATCTQTGRLNGKHCTRCNAITLIQIPIPKLGHKLVTIDHKPPTCSEAGWTTHKVCSRKNCDYKEDYHELLKIPHRFEVILMSAPLCERPGAERYDCMDCDYFETHTLAALGHAKVQHEAKPNTCTEIGWEAYETCNRTDCTYSTYVEIPAAHTFGSWTQTVEPKCEEKGEERRECLHCGHSETREVTQLGHTEETDASVAPGCTTTGLTEGKHCSVCNKTLVEQTIVDALGHDTTAHDAKTPTCTEVGWDAYVTCNRANCTYSTYAEKAALDHDLEPHDAKAPTCSEIGWDAYDTCKRTDCTYSTYAEKPTLDHDLEPHDAKAPTCTEIGWDAYVTCKRTDCTYSTYAEKAALDHDLEPHAAKAPTCTEIGWDAYDTCKRTDCTYSTYVEKAALGHDETSHDAKAPTCTEVGWDAYVDCSRCNYTTYVQISENGHSYGNWIQISAPKCEAPGSERRNCTRCNNYETRKIDALGHYEISHAAKAPTCTEYGHKEYVSCANCDYSTYVRLPSAHTFDAWVETLAPECDVKGEERRECLYCDHFEARDVEPLGHNDKDENGKCDSCGTKISAGSTDTPSASEKGELSTGAVVGIAAGSTVTGVGGVTLAWFAIKKKWFLKLFKLFKG